MSSFPGNLRRLSRVMSQNVRVEMMEWLSTRAVCLAPIMASWTNKMWFFLRLHIRFISSVQFRQKCFVFLDVCTFWNTGILKASRLAYLTHLGELLKSGQ